MSLVWSNLVRHAALHWGVPSDRINDMTLDVVHGILGDLIVIPGATFRDQSLTITYSKLEHYAGNFLHFWVLAASLLGIVLFARRFRYGMPTVCLALAIVLGIIVYSVLIKWDPGASRRVTPLFMLGAPIAAIFVSSLGVRIRGHFTKIFLIMSVPWIFFNETRPIYSDHGRSILSVNRTEEYFHNIDKLSRPYVRVVDHLKEHRPQEIGIELNQYEYPFRVLVKERLKESPRLEHIVVENVSKSLRAGNYTPPYVVSINEAVDTIGGVSYRIVWISPEVIILAREDIAIELVDEIFDGDTLVIESNYDVYVRDNALLYVKEPCSQEDVEPTFFVHVVPVDVKELPDHRRRYGADNLDFRFEEHGWRSGDRCLAARRLPTYAIRHVETGQYGPGGGRLWVGSIPFDGEPETG